MPPRLPPAVPMLLTTMFERGVTGGLVFAESKGVSAFSREEGVDPRGDGVEEEANK